MNSSDRLQLSWIIYLIPVTRKSDETDKALLLWKVELLLWKMEQPNNGNWSLKYYLIRKVDSLRRAESGRTEIAEKTNHVECDCSILTLNLSSRVSGDVLSSRDLLFVFNSLIMYSPFLTCVVSRFSLLWYIPALRRCLQRGLRQRPPLCWARKVGMLLPMVQYPTISFGIPRRILWRMTWRRGTTFDTFYLPFPSV